MAALSGCALGLLNWLLVIPEHNSLCGATMCGVTVRCEVSAKGGAWGATFGLVFR